MDFYYGGEKLKEKEYHEYVWEINQDAEFVIAYIRENGEKIKLNEKQHEELVQMYEGLNNDWGCVIIIFVLFSAAFISVAIKDWSLAVFLISISIVCIGLYFWLLFSKKSKKNKENNQRKIDMVKEEQFEAFSLDITRRIYFIDNWSRFTREKFFIACGGIGVERETACLFRRARTKLIFVIVTFENEIEIKHLPM